jgi:hypothetical protein
VNTASGSETATTTLENTLSIVTEIASDHEAAYHYIVGEDDGETYVSIKDVVGSLLEFSEKLEGMGGIYEQIGDAFTQVAVQLAEPFMQVPTETATILSLLNTSPSGGAE